LGTDADAEDDAHDPFADYRGLEFMQSRIPIQDALSAFTPEGDSVSSVVEAASREVAEARWYPRPGGLELLIPHHGEPFDAAVFTVKPGAWDHETCSHCVARIPPMTLCWVTRSGWYVLLCEDCYGKFTIEHPRRITMRSS
jgi:hypothetical protein